MEIVHSLWKVLVLFICKSILGLERHHFSIILPSVYGIVVLGYIYLLAQSKSVRPFLLANNFWSEMHNWL